MHIGNYYSQNPYAKPYAETLDDYDAIIQGTNKIIKSKEAEVLELKPTQMIHNVLFRHGEISGDMMVKTYTDEEFTVYHEGLKMTLTFKPWMLPKISYNGKVFFKLFDSEMVSAINPDFKPDTLVQLIRDPKCDFSIDEVDFTGLFYIEEYDGGLEGFTVTHIRKKSTGWENRPYTLVAPTRFFSVDELKKYLFRVLDVDFGKIRDN